MWRYAVFLPDGNPPAMDNGADRLVWILGLTVARRAGGTFFRSHQSFPTLTPQLFVRRNSILGYCPMLAIGSGSFPPTYGTRA